jgi:hypothetical protein
LKLLLHRPIAKSFNNLFITFFFVNGLNDWLQAELRRLYTQLQIYKTKSMRRDNPHISKRRGGRKPTHRRFSLQAFHYKHRLQQAGEHSIGEGHDLEPASRTPEESTNSAEMGQIISQGVNDEQVSSSPRTTSGGTLRKQ